MPLRSRKRHIGEVNMSSMTDIIFMLLIFFMLTSTLVKFLPFSLPKSNTRSNKQIKTTLNIQKDGKMSVNERPVTMANVESVLRSTLGTSDDRNEPTITIAAEVGVPFSEVQKMLQVANKVNAKAKTVIATEPTD